MDGDFPKMLFKRGDETVIFDKLNVDTKIVNNQGELATALAQGWHDDAMALNKLQYQEGGDPPTPEGGYPCDHDFAKGLEGQKGRADRFPGLEKEAEAAKKRAKKDEEGEVEAVAYVYPPGNPPRSEDPSVPPPPAETEGADELKENPGEATEKAEKEFAKQAEEDADRNFGDRRDKDAKGDATSAVVREANMRAVAKEAEERRGPGRPRTDEGKKK